MWGIDASKWTHPYKWHQNWFISFYWWCQTFNPDTWDFWVTRGTYRFWGYNYFYYDGPIYTWGFWLFTISHAPWQQHTAKPAWGWTEVEIAALLKEYADEPV